MVQVMCDVVAIAALGEAGQHAGRMWCAVAALASRHSLMLVFVTGYTGNSLMLCIAGNKMIECLLVAGCAHLVGCVGCIGNSSRHMRLVAALALGSAHIRAVRFMTLGTLWDFTVHVVAETASQIGVLALNLLQLDDLLGVAGQALFGDVVGQFDDLRGMRVVVATEAVCQLVVRLAFMTLAAQRDDLLDGRRMAGVAILTGYICFVGSTICSNSLGCGRMAFGTIGVAEGRFRCRWLGAKRNSGKHYRQH